MAYGTACSTCTQVPLFSTPYVTVGGHVMGDADAAYNACVVHQLFDYVARFDGVLTGDDYQIEFGVKRARRRSRHHR